MIISVNDQIHFSEIQPSDQAAVLEHLQEKEIYDRTLRIPYPYTKDGKYLDARLFALVKE